MADLPPMWLIDLLEGKLASRCLDSAADRRIVAEAITNEMMQRMMYKTPKHQGGKLRSLGRRVDDTARRSMARKRSA